MKSAQTITSIIWIVVGLAVVALAAALLVDRETDTAEAALITEWGNFDCANGLATADALGVMSEAAGLEVPPQGLGCPAMGESVSVDGWTWTWGDIDCNGGPLSPDDAIKILMKIVGAIVTQTVSGCPGVGQPVTVDSTSTPTSTPTTPAGYSINLPPFYTDPDQFQATVSSIQNMQSIPGSGFYETVSAPPGADYAVVSMSVRNFGATADSVGTFSFRLKDSPGHVFTIDFDDDLNANSTAQAYYGKQGLYDTIQPGLTLLMVFVFLVPDGKAGLIAERCSNSGCDTSSLDGVAPVGCSFTIPSFYSDPDQFCATNVSVAKVTTIPGSGFYDPVTAPAGSKYAVVQMNAMNYGYIPGYIGSFSFRLRDSQNRLFTIDFENDLTVNSTAQSYYDRRGLYDTIQPELTDSLVFVFLVPDDANGLLGEACPNNGCD